jgi:hypothetical protein
VLVFVHTISATDTVTSVTYGGTGLTRVDGGAAIDSAGEPGRTDLFFLGSGLASGNQTITVNRTNNATVMYAAAATVTAATATNVTGIVLLEGDGTMTVQSVTDGGAPTNSLRYAGAYSGLQAPPPAGTGSTLLTSIDFGNFGAALVRETTAGTGARDVGFNSNSDDRAAVHVAVRELWNRTDTQTVGAFTLTGVAATFGVNHPISGGTGSFSFVGRDTTLTKAEGPATLFAEPGSVTLTGNDATTLHNVSLVGNTRNIFLPERNTITRSSELNAPNISEGFARSNCTVSVSPDILAPNGELQTVLFKETSDVSNSQHRLQPINQVTFLVGRYYGLSLYVKHYAGTSPRGIKLYFNSSLSYATFSISESGVTLIASSGTLDRGFIGQGNGWYRLFLVDNVNTNQTTTPCFFYLTNGTSDSYIGDGESGVYVWGAQLEEISKEFYSYEAYPSTYDPTNFTAVNSNSLLHNSRIVADIGPLALTGHDVTLAKGTAGTLTLPAEVGALTLTGNPASTRHNPSIDAGSGVFSLTGQPATLSKTSSTTLIAETGAFALTGNPADTRHNPRIDGGVGAISFTGQPATFTRSRVIAGDTGAFATAGPPALLRHNPRIEAATGSFALTGGSPALLRGRYLSGGAGTFTETGQPTTFRRTRAIQGGTGAFSLTGYPAALTEINAYQINALVGAFSLTGNAAQLARSRRFSVVAGGFSFTGQAAGLRQAYALTADRGQFALTGGSPSLTWSRRSTFNTGSFSLTGNTAALLHATKLTGETGAFALTGLVAGLAKQSARELAVNTGLFSLTGRPATLKRALLFGVSSGSFTLGSPSPVLQRGCVTTGGRGEFLLSGQPAALLKAYVLDASMGAFDLTGQSANLTDTDELYPAAGAFSLSGQDAGLARSRTMPVSAGVFSLSGQATALLEGRGLTAERGTFSLSGQQNTLRQGYLLSGAAGSISLIGNAAGLSKQTARELLGGVGAFSATGQAASLRQNPASAADRGQFTLSGQQATLKQGYLLTSAAGTFSLTGNPATLAKQSAKQLTAEAGALTLTGHAASLTVLGTVTRRRNVLIF